MSVSRAYLLWPAKWCNVTSELKGGVSRIGAHVDSMDGYLGRAWTLSASLPHKSRRTWKE
eukprot:1941641-Amphidinium_carterae.1